MLFKNAVIENDKMRDFRVTGGLFSEIAENIEAYPDEEVFDLAHKLVLPPFVEAHIHLDTAMTAGEPRHNRSGTLFEGIEIWSERKTSLNKEDVKKRARQAVRRLISHGVQHLRTHVDCTDPTLTAMEAMLELKDEIKDIFDIQIVAFPQEGILSFPNGRDLLENAMKMGADCVGAIPHYEFTREYSVESLKIAMDIAEKYDALVDVHCDEIDYAESHGLETLACLAYERGMGERVTASHTTAMHSYDNAYMRKLSRLLALSKINFVANPLVNIHLQGRLDNYPKRRGLTRVKELLANGNNVAFGHDDIMDPWYPTGDGNPMDTVHMGLHVGQLMGYDDIAESYRFVTHRAAACLSLDYGIEKGKKANFIVLDAKHWYEALNRRAVILKSVRAGKVLCGTEPAKSFLNASI